MIGRSAARFANEQGERLALQPVGRVLGGGKGLRRDHHVKGAGSIEARPLDMLAQRFEEKIVTPAIAPQIDDQPRRRGILHGRKTGAGERAKGRGIDAERVAGDVDRCSAALDEIASRCVAGGRRPDFDLCHLSLQRTEINTALGAWAQLRFYAARPGHRLKAYRSCGVINRAKSMQQGRGEHRCSPAVRPGLAAGPVRGKGADQRRNLHRSKVCDPCAEERRAFVFGADDIGAIMKHPHADRQAQ